MTTNQSPNSSLQDMLKSAYQAVIESIDGIQEAEIRLIPAPDEWTVAQLLAHIAEIEYFWMEKAVLITKEDDPNITRSDVENDRRTAAVVDHAGDSLDELIRGLSTANDAAVTVVGNIAPRDMSILGHRGENNPISVEGVIQSLAGHMTEHANQITESRRLIGLNSPA